MCNSVLNTLAYDVTNIIGGGVFKMKITQIYTARDDKDFVAKAQSFCKIFRQNICKISLRAMAEKFGLNLKNLSAWENGRSNKAEYLFYYYDLTSDETLKKQYLDAIFNSDGKNLVIDTTVNLENDKETTTIRIVDREN